MTTKEARREARGRGLPWSAVQEAYYELKEREWAKRERPNEVREAAWMIANAHAPGSWGFWRHGFERRFGRRVYLSDYTAIPNYDTIAQQIGWYYPEYATDDGTERLFDFLMSPHQTYPTRERLLREALDRVEHAKQTGDRTDDRIHF